MKVKNKFLIILCIIFIVINNMSLVVNATTYNIGDDISLTGYGSVSSHVRNRENGDYAITTDLVGYYIGETFYPAYCLNRGSDGADNSYIHTVNISQLLKSEELYNRIWRVIRAGYPYHTAEELKVDDWTYAYQATKMAIYHIVGEYSEKEIEKTNIENYYGIDQIGERTVDLMKRLVNEGKNGKGRYEAASSSITNPENIRLEGDYYIVDYRIRTNGELRAYSISITDFPEGTFVTNVDGIPKTEFKQEGFQIRIPKNAVETGDINGNILASVNVGAYPILFGKTYDPRKQNYAITAEPIEIVNPTKKLELKGNTATIKIRKIDKDTNNPICGTEYELTDSNGNVIGVGTTDANGILTFNELYQDTYVLKEIKSNEDYVISEEAIEIRATYNTVTEKTLTNEHKKGNIKVQKVDKDNNKIVLGNVEFDLYSEELGRIVGTYKTDVNGEIFIGNLRTGKYKVIEKETNKWYNLAEEVEINVKWDKTADATIQNELKKGQVKIIKVDKEDNKIKLENVKFEVLNKEGKVLETITTDKNGEGYTSKYPIRDYDKLILREIETLDEYSINDIPQEIELKENETITMQFENEVKKGQIKIIKQDKDNKEIKLEGVKFEVYDEEDNLVQTLITDKNGEAITDRIRINKSYYVKEVETKENYKLSEEIITVTLKENEIKEIILENEKKKGQIKVIKVDSENKEIHIPNVTFEIYNKDNEQVDIITTNSEGIAITKKLPIDNEYTIKETITAKEYVLNENIQTVTLEEDKITDITFENTKKYGKIKISKLSNKYSQILNWEENSPIANTKFIILNEKGENLGIYTTDENGSILIEKLPYGEYTIYEYEVPEYFLKDTTPQTVAIIENNQIAELIFKNTPKEPELPKTGF